MNYLTEARRLGVDSIKYLTPVYGIANDFLGHNPLDLDQRPVREEDGLHVTGCFQCRGFRNAVRKVLETEKELPVLNEDSYDRIYTWADMDGSYDAGFRDGIAAVRRIAERYSDDMDAELRKLAVGGR